MTTQAEQIISHFIKRPHITASEAISLYGITRLASVIERLRADGLKVIPVYKKGVRCTRYAEYHIDESTREQLLTA